MNLTEIQLMKTMAAHPRNMHIILFILFIYLFILHNSKYVRNFMYLKTKVR